ncbi:MAG TPA: CBS domain-containing protein [Candidatus Dormibacteraeota bacterium]|nr:CBS domain-containing protein [Candidatus Dormibacteraeota bacterium]
MTKDPVTIGTATSFKACANIMRIHELSAVPVVDRACRIVGIVSEADLLAKEARPVRGKAKAMKAAELMTADLVTTTAGSPLATAASLMFQHHVKVLPVVDPQQHLVGVVNRAQVLKVFLRSDESIRKEVVTSLGDAPSLAFAESQIEVKDGVVHAYGVADADSAAEPITRRVMAIPGVVGVNFHAMPLVLDESYG